GADGCSVEQHSTCAALPESAAESGTVDSEILLQHVEQWSRWVVNSYVDRPPVDLHCVSWHSGILEMSKVVAHYNWRDAQCQSAGLCTLCTKSRCERQPLS